MDKHYPLKDLKKIKTLRQEEAEKKLKECKEKLKKCEEELLKAEESSKKAEDYLQEKIRLLMEESSNVPRMHEMDLFIKEIARPKKDEAEKITQDKRRLVSEAKIAVEKALADVIEAEKGVIKIDMHQKEWEKEKYIEITRQEEIQLSDFSTSAHSRKKRDKER